METDEVSAAVVQRLRDNIESQRDALLKMKEHIEHEAFLCQEQQRKMQFKYEKQSETVVALKRELERLQPRLVDRLASKANIARVRHLQRMVALQRHALADIRSAVDFESVFDDLRHECSALIQRVVTKRRKSIDRTANSKTQKCKEGAH